MAGVSNLNQIKAIVGECLESGEPSDRCEIMSGRSGSRGMLMRVSVAEGPSVIVKVWRARRAREDLKRICRTSSARREWRVHRHLERAGLNLPRPLGFFVLSVDGRGVHEFMVTEDLGQTERGFFHLKRLVAMRAEADIERFEKAVIDLTQAMLRARVLDVDHQLHNVVVDGNGRLVRLDLECAHWYRLRRFPVSVYGTMLARLVSSHVYACQPEVERSGAFAAHLAQQIKPPAQVLAQAEERIGRYLDRQRTQHGVDSQLSLAWSP